MGMCDGGGTDVTNSSKVEYPEWQEKAYQLAVNEAMRLYTGGPNVTGWQAVPDDTNPSYYSSPEVATQTAWKTGDLSAYGVKPTGYSWQPIYGDSTEGGKLNYYSGGVADQTDMQKAALALAGNLGNLSPTTMGRSSTISPTLGGVVGAALNNSGALPTSGNLIASGNSYFQNLLENPQTITAPTDITAPSAYTPTGYTPTDITAPENYQAALASAPTLSGNGLQVTAPTIGATSKITSDDVTAALINADYGKAWSEINPYVEQLAKNAADPIYEQFIEETLPTLRSKAVAAGRYGGGIPALQEAQAAQDIEKEMLAARGNIYGTAWENAAGREYSRASTQAQLQQSAALANQQARLAASTGNAQLAQEKALEAARLSMQAQQLNQATQTTYDTTRYQGGLTTALANQSALNEAAKTGYAGQLSASLANQQTGLTAGLANESNALEAALANRAQQLEASKTNYAGALQTTQDQLQQQALYQAAAQVALSQGLAQGTADYNAQWMNAQNLYNFGGLEQSYNQAVADEAAKKLNWEQMEPYQRLQLLESLIGGNAGSTTTSTQSGGGASTLSQLAGLGLSGAGIYNLLGLGGGAAAAGTVGAAGGTVATAAEMAAMLGGGASLLGEGGAAAALGLLAL